MKATGIIRRIDELGRIVVPKEIRKTLRIKDGENLEIFTDKDQIILKKYSLIKNLDEFAQNFADSIHIFTKCNVLICDNDTILAVSGNNKKEYLNKNISEQLLVMINRRIELMEKHTKSLKIIEEKEIECQYVISPIVVNGDSIGLVLIFDEANISDNELKIAQIASKFIKTHLEIV